MFREELKSVFDNIKIFCIEAGITIFSSPTEENNMKWYYEQSMEKG